jgi:uncharacterized protein
MAEPLKLTTVERLMLANQYQILEKLCPKEAAYYAEVRETVEQGYEGHYYRLLRSITRETVSKEQCDEVLDVLTMFSCLKSSYKALTDKTGIKASEVKFDGFDGNSEGDLLSFANFFCKADGGRFGDLIKLEVPNSHSSSIDMYKRMLRVFTVEKGSRPNNMSKESIQKIVAARTFDHG